MEFADHILVPVDFSPGSAAALRRAFELAGSEGLAIRVVHVLPHPSEQERGDWDDSLWADLRADARKRLEALRDGHAGQEHLVAAKFREGDPVEVICEAASSGTTRYIAMGSHGRSGPKRTLLGSVSDRVLRRAPVPVLVTRDHGGEPSAPVRSVLFATDFSPNAVASEASVARLAQHQGEGVEILHVVPDPTIVFSAYVSPDALRFENDLFEVAKARLDETRARFENMGVPSTRTTIAVGDPAHEIVARAAEREGALVALGSRGHSVRANAWRGGVCQRVLEDCNRDVFVIGPKSHAA